MKGRNFIGAYDKGVAAVAPAGQLDDFIMSRDGLRCLTRLDGMRTVYGVANGLGIVLAESLRFQAKDEWIYQLART